MSMIDTAAFFLVLDDFDHEIDHMEPSTLADNGKVSESQVSQPLDIIITFLVDLSHFMLLLTYHISC